MIEQLAINEFEFDAGHTVWDVRDPKAFDERHIKGAINKPIKQIGEADVDQLKGKPVYVLCGGGSRAPKAAQLITEINPEQKVIVLQGGTRKAVAEGLPLVTAD